MEVTIWQRRSLRNHNHFFAFLGNLVKSGAVPFENTEAFLDALKVACQWTKPMLDMKGKPIGMAPRSIAFSKAEEPAFKEFKNIALALIASHYGVTPEDL